MMLMQAPSLCSFIRAQKVLRAFFGAREVVRKALGRSLYYVNPKRCMCPFFSTLKKSRCKQVDNGTVELNRLNDLSNFITHLKTQHTDNEAAQVAAARLKKADDFRMITPEKLDAEVGKIDWDMESGDGYGPQVRQITHQGDAFEPNFELGTDEHANWVKQAISEFE